MALAEIVDEVSDAPEGNLFGGDGGGFGLKSHQQYLQQGFIPCASSRPLRWYDSGRLLGYMAS